MENNENNNLSPETLAFLEKYKDNKGVEEDSYDLEEEEDGVVWDSYQEDQYDDTPQDNPPKNKKSILNRFKYLIFGLFITLIVWGGYVLFQSGLFSQQPLSYMYSPWDVMRTSDFVSQQKWYKIWINRCFRTSVSDTSKGLKLNLGKGENSCSLPNTKFNTVIIRDLLWLCSDPKWDWSDISAYCNSKSFTLAEVWKIVDKRSIDSCFRLNRGNWMIEQAACYDYSQSDFLASTVEWVDANKVFEIKNIDMDENSFSIKLKLREPEVVSNDLDGGFFSNLLSFNQKK